MDAHKNFAYSTVATAPSPATSGTTLVVAAGTGALFPVAPFNATVWPANTQPTEANAEIVRVTAKTTDTLTIIRAQEGSSARTIGVGDQIANTITAKALTDIESATGLPAWLMNGAGNPLGVVTPSQEGAVYLDTSAVDNPPFLGGAFYVAVGTTSADWIQIAGPAGIDGGGLYNIPGVSFTFQGGQLNLWLAVPNNNSSASLTDVDALNGTGNGIFWQARTADGEQTALIQVGVDGAFDHRWPADGSYVFPGALTGATWGIAPDGSEYLVATSAPADADVGNGQRFQWFDGTTGKLMFKARTSAGVLTSGISASQGYVDSAVSALSSVYQPLDSDLTAIAALTTTTFGRALLALADAAALRTAAGLGTLATQSGTFSGTSSGTNTGDQTTVSGNAGTATALATARAIDGQSFNGTADITVIAPGTHAATGKTTPVDADEVPLVDSAASNVLKKLTWANLKATMKTYFDTLYQALDAELTALAGLTSAADKLPYFTGAGTAATTTLSSFIRTLIDDADAATARATIGAGTSSVAALSDLSDGSSATPVVGQALVYANSKYRNGIPPWTFTPAGKIENLPRWFNWNISTSLVTQRTFLCGVYLTAGMTVNSISFLSGATALSGGNHQYFVLYDDEAGHETGTARARLALSADDTATAWAANTVKTLNMATPYTILKSGLFYLGVLVDATTPPSLIATNNGLGGNSVLSAMSPIVANFNTGTTTSPANPATALNTGSQAAPYCYCTVS